MRTPPGSYVVRQFEPNEDIIRQEITPTAAALRHGGSVRPASQRSQTISLIPHSGRHARRAGPFYRSNEPLALRLESAVIAFIPNSDLIRLFKPRPSVSFAIWRGILIDASIFRGAIAKNSARPVLARMAHLFCEIFYRARASKIVLQNRVPLPLSLVQLGERRRLPRHRASMKIKLPGLKRKFPRLRSARKPRKSGGRMKNAVLKRMCAKQAAPNRKSRRA